MDAEIIEPVLTGCAAWLPLDSACGCLIAARDWSDTPLGPLPHWPISLRTAVGSVLASSVPIVLLWGEEGIMLYNDAYSVFAGGRHPQLLGSRVREGWPEVADFNNNVMEVVLGGGTLSYKDQELVLHRDGRPEQVCLNMDYSPVPGEDGSPAGVLAIVFETTDRRIAEGAAREASERLGLALDAGAIVGTWVWNIPEDLFLADERFAASFDINPELCRTGLPLNMVMDSIHPDDRERVSGVIDAVLKEGGSYRCDYRVRRPHSGYYWVSASGRVEKDADGTPLRFPGVLIEADQQKRVEELRIIQNELLELAVSDAPLATLLDMLMKTVEARSSAGTLGSILLLDRDGLHLRHGAAPSLPAAYCEAIDGLEIGPDVGSCGTAAYIGEPVFVSDIADDPRWAAFRELALGHGLRACWSLPIAAADGSLLGTFAMYYPEPREPIAADLELVGLVTRTASLIIERIRAEAELREVSDRLDAVLNNTMMAVFVMNERQHCIFANKAAERLTGYSFDELRVAPLHDVIHNKKPDGSHYPLEECPIDRAFPKNDQVQGEELFVHKDGSFYPVAFTASPIRDAASRTVGTIIEARNITEEKARAAELAEALHTKDVLLHEVNHRVKNSLQVVTGLLMLQAGQAKDPTLRQALMEARGRIAVVAAMHQRLYSTSQHDRVDFGDYVRELAQETVSSLGDGGRIGLQGDVETGIMVTLQQAVPLALVVSELVTNALKYAYPEDRTGNVHILLQRSQETLILEVADTGVGLPADFEPSHRGGIGMRIVTSLIKQMRGTLEITSEGSGTRFRINLPVERLV